MRQTQGSPSGGCARMGRSAFNGHQSNGKCRSQPDDVRQLWAALAGKKRFPLKELVPLSYTVGHLL
jgi:hypothetical protein